MIYAGRKRKATEAQIRLILKLTDQSDLNNVKNLENCPPVVRYKEDLNKNIWTIEPPRKLSTV